MKPIKSLRQILSQEMMDGSKRYGPSGDQRTAGEVPTRFAEQQASPFPSAAACAAAGRRPFPLGRYPLSVAQIFNLPYRRFVIGGTLLASGRWQVKNLRYSRLQVCATGGLSSRQSLACRTGKSGEPTGWKACTWLAIHTPGILRQTKLRRPRRFQRSGTGVPPVRILQSTHGRDARATIA